jgi:FkbM family methyltransferase
MSLAELKKAYASGSLGKQEYIVEMHRLHSLLYEYPDFLRGTDIARIEITEEGVIMTFRRSGIQMLCHPRDKRIVPIETLNFGQYEKDELDLILKMIRPGSTVLDVGANVGWYSLNIAKAVPGVRIFAFEPIPDTFKNLCTNIRINGVSNIEAQNFGLSDKAGKIVFYFCDDSSGSASAANIGERSDAREIPCQIMTMDEFVEDRQLKIEFIKCDVEGAELLVFRGAGKCLASQKPVILVEMLRKWSAKFHYHPNEIISLLSDIGYGCYAIDHGKLIPLPRMDEQTAATNFIFLHAQQHKQFIGELVADGPR